MHSMGDPISRREGAILRGELAAPHCKVMAHSTVSCTKTAKPIEIPFGMKTRVSPRNHVLDGSRSPKGKRQVLGVVRANEKHGDINCAETGKRLSSRHIWMDCLHGLLPGPFLLTYSVFRSTLRQSRPNKAGLKCPSVRTYVGTYVRTYVRQSTKFLRFQ